MVTVAEKELLTKTKRYVIMPSISLSERDLEVPKIGYYFAKSKYKSENEVCFCGKYGVQLIGVEGIFSFEDFEFFKSLDYVWQDAVNECCGISYYREGAIAVAAMAERLKQHDRKI